MKQMKIKLQKAHKLLDSLCETISTSNGGWAAVNPKDIENLHQLFQTIVEAKFGPDPDGDYPIDIKLIDRTRFEPLHFFAIPYDHKAKTVEEKERILDLATSNVQTASDRLNNILKLRRFDREHK